MGIMPPEQMGFWKNENKLQVWQLYARWSKNLEVWEWQVLNVSLKWHWYFFINIQMLMQLNCNSLNFKFHLRGSIIKNLKLPWMLVISTKLPTHNNIIFNVMYLLLFSRSVVSDFLWPHGLQHTRNLWASVQFSHLRLTVTPWTAALQASLSITNSQNLLKLMSLKSMMPSNHLIPFSSAFNLSQHQGLFKCVSSSHQVAKVLEFHLQHQSVQWIFRISFL